MGTQAGIVLRSASTQEVSGAGAITLSPSMEARGSSSSAPRS